MRCALVVKRSRLFESIAVFVFLAVCSAARKAVCRFRSVTSIRVDLNDVVFQKCVRRQLFPTDLRTFWHRNCRWNKRKAAGLDCICRRRSSLCFLHFFVNEKPRRDEKSDNNKNEKNNSNRSQQTHRKRQSAEFLFCFSNGLQKNTHRDKSVFLLSNRVFITCFPLIKTHIYYNKNAYEFFFSFFFCFTEREERQLPRKMQAAYRKRCCQTRQLIIAPHLDLA